MRSFDDIRADVTRAVGKRDVEALRILIDELVAVSSPSAEALAAHTRGFMFRLQGRHEEAQQAYDGALTAYEDLNDVQGIARTILSLGNLHADRNEYEIALQYYERALTYYEREGSAVVIARTHHNMGIAHERLGAYEKALSAYEHALDVFEDTQNHSGIAHACNGIGNVHSSTGDYVRAVEFYQRALTIFEETHDRVGAASTLGNLGILLERLRDTDAAVDYHERALELFRDIGDTVGVARATNSIGSIHMSRGQAEEALGYFYVARALHEDMGNRISADSVTGNIVAALLNLGRYDDARTALNSVVLSDAVEPAVRAEFYANRATLELRAGNTEAAHDALSMALRICHEAGLRSEEAQYHLQLRDLAMTTKDFDRYVYHNNLYLQRTEEIQSSAAAQRLATLQAQRTIDSERREREKERAVLYSTLPRDIADRVLRGDDVSGDTYDDVSIFVADIVGFTALSDKLPARDVVDVLDRVFSIIDDIVDEHRLMKIKTVGDSYIGVAFPQSGDTSTEPHNNHRIRAARCACDILSRIAEQNIPIRIGLHHGPVTAGIIGTRRLQYDVWGDTVNVACRLESTGTPNTIHLSESFALSLPAGPWRLEYRGPTSLKGKGDTTTYWMTPVKG